VETTVSFPTIMGPWYVVQRIVYGLGRDQRDDFGIRHIDYFTSSEESDQVFQREKKLALLFMSLQSATRVAESEGAEIRVLYNKEHAEEFGRS
jgi:hypothetical protein